MTDKNAVQDVIFRALKSLNQEREAEDQIDIGPETLLFGPDAVLNSLELVSVMVDIETMADDEFGQAISLTDDEAMGSDPVPFVSVSALTAYMLELLRQ